MMVVVQPWSLQSKGLGMESRVTLAAANQTGSAEAALCHCILLSHINAQWTAMGLGTAQGSCECLIL